MGLCALLLCAGTSLSILSLQHRWTTTLRTVRRLDHCVARFAVRYQTGVETIRTANREIRAIRASLTTGIPLLPPPLQAAARAGATARLQVLELERKLEVSRWAISISEIASDCSIPAHPVHWPESLGFSFAPADALGPAPWPEVRAWRMEWVQLRASSYESGAMLELRPESITRRWAIRPSGT